MEFNDFIKLLLLVYCIRLKLPFSKFLMFARGYSFVKKNGRYTMSIYVLLLLGFDTIKLIWFFPICKTYTGLYGVEYAAKIRSDPSLARLGGEPSGWV